MALYRHFKGRPLILSSNTKVLHRENIPFHYFRSIYLVRHFVEWMDATEGLEAIWPRSFGECLRDGLVFWSVAPCEGERKQVGKWRWLPRFRGLTFWLNRKRRIASTGSHSTLWGQDHGPVGGAGWQIYDNETARFLGTYKSVRRYTQALYEALKATGGFEFYWLADVMPQWRPKNASHPYGDLPARVRSDLVNDEVLSETPGAVPLIYLRRGNDWELFSVKDELSDRTRRTTTELIDQYVAYSNLYPDSKRVAVLTKLLRSDARWRNPLDNPIISPAQRQHARAAGIEAVLLDARYGIVEVATKPPVAMYEATLWIDGKAVTDETDENDPRIATPVYAA